MFKRVKLKSYLLTVFSVVIVLCGLTALVGVVGLMVTRSNTKYLVDRTMNADLAVKMCRIEVNTAARNLREMLLLPNSSQYDEFEEKINTSIANIQSQVALFKEAHGEEDGLAQTYEDAFDSWFSIANRAISELKSGNKDEATDIVLTECSPALSNLVDISKQIDQTITAEKQEQQALTTGMLNLFVTVLCAVFIVVLCISLYFAFSTTKTITGVVAHIKDAVLELSKGNLKAKVDYEANNEFGELAERMNFSFQELARYVNEIDKGMSSFSQGDFTYRSSITFLGDFVNIERSISGFQSKMNDTLVELGTISKQVTVGSEQVASGSQTLAQGATEQASSVEELSATIAEVSNHISNTAEYLQKADALGKEAGEVVATSQHEMKQMLKAIKDIAVAAENIQKIIKVIDDIAFQTNILALNAAVEAARAGSAGKGFAVVADEVRNLAQKSAEAAQNTTQLIENSLMHVKHGESLAASTDVAFDKVAKESEEILGMIEKIAQASKEQAKSISQISEGVSQISSVVQMSSSATEASAAASEELSGQARIMESLLEKFELSRDAEQKFDFKPSAAPSGSSSATASSVDFSDYSGKY